MPIDSKDSMKSPSLPELGNLSKDDLVEIVKLVQKQGLKGSKGGWKDFLNFHDKKLGSSLSDPSRRRIDVLATFLATFTKQEDLQAFSKIIKCINNRKALHQLSQDLSGSPTLYQKMVQVTVNHPLYAMNYTFPSHKEDWVMTKLGKLSKAVKSNKMIAVDCEMVLCEDGSDAVVKVCAVDNNLEVKLDTFVNPNKPIADYRNHITGISAEDLNGVSVSLADVQKSMKKLLSHGTILVGHSLHSDLQVMKIDHARVIDTSFIFKFVGEPVRSRPSLSNLCKSLLGYELRKEGSPHDCLEDARTAMKLVLAKLDHSFDEPYAIMKDVPMLEFAKLLLHKIPIDVPMEELPKIFPKGYDVEMQPKLKVKGAMYSTTATFKDSVEACAAYERVKGEEETDSYGRPQKLVSLQLNSGNSVTLYVRKNSTESEKKRSADNDHTEPKRLKTDDSPKEIERLKEELRQKDAEIANLQKILSALTRKHGL